MHKDCAIQLKLQPLAREIKDGSEPEFRMNYGRDTNVTSQDILGICILKYLSFSEFCCVPTRALYVAIEDQINLKMMDLEPTETSGGAPRWKHNSRFARRQLFQKGLIGECKFHKWGKDPGWKISKAGRIQFEFFRLEH